MLEESASILEALGDRFIYVNVLISRGILAFSRGDYTIAKELFDQGLSVAREIKDPWGMADALTNLGCVLRVQGDYDAARLHFEQALEAYRHWGRSAWCADPLCALSENAMSQGDLSSASSYLQEAAQYTEGSRNSWLEVLVIYFLGLLAYYQGDLNGAGNLLERAIAIARESRFRPDLSRSLVTLGRVLRAQGQAEQARLLITEGLSMFVECDCRLGIATALEALAGAASPENAQPAASLLGTAEALRTTIGAPLPPVDRLAHERDVAEIRTRLDESLFTEAWERGQAESYKAVVAEILTVFRSKHPPTAGSTAHDGLPPRPTTALGST